MFQKGDTVRYGQAGVCRVEEIKRMKMGGEEQDYYVLMPLQKAGATLFVPCANEALVSKMLPPLTPDQIEAVVHDVREKSPEWIRDFRRRSEASKKALSSGDRRDALYLIKNIYAHKLDILGEGKRIHTTDDYFLKDAENLIYFEFSYVLGEEMQDVAERFRKEFGVLDAKGLILL